MQKLCFLYHILELEMVRTAIFLQTVSEPWKGSAFCRKKQLACISGRVSKQALSHWKGLNYYQLSVWYTLRCTVKIPCTIQDEYFVHNCVMNCWLTDCWSGSRDRAMNTSSISGPFLPLSFHHGSSAQYLMSYTEDWSCVSVKCLKCQFLSKNEQFSGC